MEESDRHPICRQWIDKVLKIACESMHDEDRELRQGATFAIGACAALMGEQLQPAAQQLTRELLRVVTAEGSREEEQTPATDNAISSLLKLYIYCYSSGNHPAIQQNSELVQAMKQFVSWLPCIGDEDEACLIHARVVVLVEQNNPLIVGDHHSNLPAIVRLFARIINNENLCNQESKGKMVQLILQMRSQLPPAQFQQLWGSLTADEQQELAKNLQQ